LIAGLDVDVIGARSALALARRTGAVVDHAGGRAKYRNLHALQEFGGITTTFAEARNRADLVVLVGDGWAGRFPRFLERIVAPVPSEASGAARRIVTVTGIDPATRVALPNGAEVLALDAPLLGLPALCTMLQALVDGRPVQPARLAGVVPQALVRCADWMRAARYGVIVWSAADLDWPHAELAVQAIARLIRTLNASTRFAALPLAGTDADLTANAVQTWQSGVPLPASYANGSVDFDPNRYAWRDVLARGEADALLWVSSLSGAAPPPAPGVPTIALTRADVRLGMAPNVQIPVATPGIDASGHLLRSDKVITLRLPRLRESGLPSASTVLDALLAQLGQRC
jgi:formylmethanofuran dehydrogenase subunit B